MIGVDAVRRWISPNLLAPAMAVVAGAVALLTTLAVSGQLPTLGSAILLASAAILFSAAYPTAPRPAVETRLPLLARDLRLPIGLATIVTGCALAAVGAYNGYNSFDNLFSGGFLQYTIGGLIIGSGLLLVSGARPWSDIHRLGANLRKHRVEAISVALVLLGGIALRLYHLGEFPPSTSFAIVDEPQMGLGATNFLLHGGHPWQYPESIYSAVVAIKWFGDSMETVRYPDVLASCLVLCVFYALARSFFTWPVALAGTMLLAVSRWDIAYSRMVLPSRIMMLYEITIIFLAVRAVRGRGTYFDYAAMGLLTGLGLYSHASFRLVPLLLLIWALGWLVMQRRNLIEAIRVQAPGWAIYLIVTLLVGLPYYGIARTAPQLAFTERFTSIMPVVFDRGSIADPGALLRGNLQDLVGFFVGPGDPWRAVDLANTPMLDQITATLFVLGLGYALLHPRRPHFLLLASWFLLTVTTGALLTIDFTAERFSGSEPAVYLLACIPIQVLWSALQVWRWPLRRAAGIGLLLALGAAAAINTHTFYSVQAHDADVLRTFDTDTTEMLRYFSAHQPGGYNFTMGTFGFPGVGSDFGWIIHEPPGRAAEDLSDMLPLHDDAGGSHVAVLIAPPFPETTILNAINLIYPHAQQTVWTDSLRPGSTFAASTISAADLAAQQGLDGPCPAPKPCKPRAGIGSKTETSFYSGSVYIPQAGTYSFNLPSGQGTLVQVRLDGKSLMAYMDLVQGWYSLRFGVQGAPSGIPLQLRWQSAAGSSDIPPSYLRRTSAHGMLQQFLRPSEPAQPLLPPARVPFPYFFYPIPHNNGRPNTPDWQYPYRAIFTGSIARGHAGTYHMDLQATGGQASLFLDGKLLATSTGDTPLMLHLNGQHQVLQLQFNVPTAFAEDLGAGLFRTLPDGTQSFLPWTWLNPPAASAPLPRWLPTPGQA